VLLRAQAITPHQLIAYSRRFGELDLHETVKPFAIRSIRSSSCSRRSRSTASPR